jgi:toxin-antitoxin system PIN domain toxin
VNGYFADVNFILAILHPDHKHSQRANAWLKEITTTGSIAICRATQMGVLRLLTKRSVMGESVLTGRDAWSYFQKLFEDDRFMFLSEPNGFVAVWQGICEGLPKAESADTDAYLAALAISANLTIVSFDNGLSRFPGVTVTVPT